MLETNPHAPTTRPRRLLTLGAAAFVIALPLGCEETAAPDTATPDVSANVAPAGAQRVVTEVEARMRTMRADDIAYAIRIRLNALPESVTKHIDVRVDAGVAKLGGHAPTLAAAHRAAEAATFVAGVTKVDADIEIRSEAARSDAEIASRIGISLDNIPALATSDLDVAVADGEARLTGTVASYQELRAAERAAAAVVGVTAIDNDVKVKVGAERSDEEIEADVQSAFAWDTLVANRNIEVQVEAGIVTLNGEVHCLAERERAAQLARVAGVKSIDTEGVAITWWKRNTTAPHTLPPSTSDDAAAEIMRRFTLDPRVPHNLVSVVVDDGIARLSGTVPSYAVKRAADAIVGSMRFKAVENNLSVATDPIADDVLEKALEERIDENPWVDASDVNVKVANGHVKLLGFVDDPAEIAEAQLAISSHPGVRDIDNALRVTDQRVVKPTDAVLAREIDLTLTHDPFIDASGVRIAVLAGHVELTGTVSSAARKRAIQVAHDAGAIKVDADELVAVD